MILIRAILGFVLAGFCLSFYWAGSQLNLIDSLRSIAADPWGAVTLLDLYTGLLVFATWIFCVERSKGVAMLWTLALLGLGNFATVAYLFIRTFRVETPHDMLFPKMR
jgi:hypothetical protein